MLSQQEQQLINDALAKAFLTQLPEPADQKTVWIEGIAKIRLADGSVGYGIVKRNPDLTHRVCYINGHISAIVEIEEVYPYITLNKDYIKKFSPKAGANPRIEYLKSLRLPWSLPMNLEELSVDDLNKEIVKAAVYQQMQDMSK